MIREYCNRFGRCIGYMADVGPIFNWTHYPMQNKMGSDIAIYGGERAYAAQMEFYGRAR